MNKETTLKLLNRFVDYNRNNMNKPFSQDLKIGKYLCATNAKIVVLIPETEETKIEDEEGYKPPNINGILPEFKEEIVVEFKDILQLYNDIPIIERFRMEECESCDGAGDFTHYGNSYECKECDEMGEVQTNMKEKVKNPNTVFRFNELDIDIQYVVSMIEIWNTAKPKTFSIAKLGRGLIWFKMDEIYIGIAGKMNIEDEKKKWDIVNVELKNLLQI